MKYSFSLRTRSFVIWLNIALIIASCGSTNDQNNEDLMVDSTIETADPHTPLTRICDPVGDQLAKASVAYSKAGTYWKEFRTRFPYHIQTMGEASMQEDRSCILILSEPAPHVTTTEIDKLLSCYDHTLTVNQQPVGYDGWVKDVVITLAGLKYSTLDTIKRALNRYLFHTDYSMSSLPLQESYKTSYSAAVQQQINYKIAPNELESWFCGDQVIAFEGGTIPQLIAGFTGQSSQLYYSRERGFVAWIIPTTQDLSSEKQVIRRFALDTDLIIGAIEKDGKLVVIGRERELSVYDLPPLRTETVLTLAAANKEELAQSYERNNIMACKLTNGKDWAPIYLSDELQNTEYGSLLNITDQLLKSWSQNGETDYVGFKYNDPSEWGFSRSLYSLVTEQFNSSALTFNWNTAGAVYEFSSNAYNIGGLNRVGSLPVSYIPDDEANMTSETYKNIEPFEQTGYQFFSGCRDANLIRAAQYAALYQIFKAFGVHSYERPAGLAVNTFQPLEDLAAQFITKIKDLTNSEIENLITRVLRRNLVLLLQHEGKEIDESRIEAALQDPGISFIEENRIAMTGALKGLQQSFERLESSLSKQMIIKMLVNRNAISSLSQNTITESDIELYESINRGLNEADFLKTNFDLLGLDGERLMKTMVEYNANHQGAWIKTPSIVLSWNKDAKASYGGHNIDAALLKVNLDASASKGYFHIENGVVRIHPDDKGLLSPSLLRKLGVEAKNAQRTGSNVIRNFSFVGGGPPRPPRSIKAVFAQAELPSNNRGFIAGFHDVLEVGVKGRNSYLVNGKQVNSCKELQAMLLAHTEKSKRAAIEFVDFTEEGIQVRLASLEAEMNIKMRTIGGFRKVKPEENLLFKNYEVGTGIHRQLYVFDKLPVERTAANGKQAIGVELAATDHSHKLYLEAQAKSPSIFGRIKTAFQNAFSFSKNNDVDFVHKTYQELLGAGLTKDDFALILSNASDCVICHKADTQEKELMAMVTKVEIRLSGK